MDRIGFKPPRKQTKLHYIFKTIKWNFFNALIGLSPVIMFWFLNERTDGKLFSNELSSALEGGAVIFVCISTMGAIIIDFRIGGFKLGAIGKFLLIYLPLIIIGLLLVDYFLIAQKAIENSFNLNTTVSKVTIGFSILYCLIGKYILYVKEDSRHK